MPPQHKHSWATNITEEESSDEVFSINSLFSEHLKVKTELSKPNSSFNSSCYKRKSVKHSAVPIGNILTWISFILPECADSDSVILFIPGNPGAIEFYDKFIEYLYIHCQIPIFGISHAGHDLIPSDSSLVKRLCKELNPDVKSSHKYTFTLEQQISHKLSFIRQYIQPIKKIILIAHSLGSYVTLQMLKRMQNTDQISQVILLFPVFERTMETSSGKFWVPFTHVLHKPVEKTSHLIEMLPPYVKRSLIEFVAARLKFSVGSIEALKSGISSLVTPNGLKNMAQIAKDLSKIGHIGDLEKVITKHKTKLTFYYGASDTWTPLSFFTQMKHKFPDSDVRLDVQGISHAFVLHHSKILAPVVADLISEKALMNDIETIESYDKKFNTFALRRSKTYRTGKNNFV